MLAFLVHKYLFIYILILLQLSYVFEMYTSIFVKNIMVGPCVLTSIVFQQAWYSPQFEVAPSLIESSSAGGGGMPKLAMVITAARGGDTGAAARGGGGDTAGRGSGVAGCSFFFGLATSPSFGVSFSFRRVAASFVALCGGSAWPIFVILKSGSSWFR